MRSTIEKTIRLVLLSVSLVTLAHGRDGAGAEEANAPRVDAGTPAPPAGRGDEVLASYSGGTFTTTDAFEQLAVMPPRSRTFLSTVPRKRKFIESAVLNELVYAEGRQAGVTRSEEVRRRIDLMRRQLKGLRKRLVIERMLARYRGGEITAGDLRAHYDANPGLYSDAKIRVREILVKDEESARKILAEVRARPDKFAEIAREKSADAEAAERGGDLGLIAEGTRPLAFDQVAFALKPGEISDVVPTRSGYYIITVTERIEGQRKPFAEVESLITTRLADFMRYEGYGRKMEELKKKAAIEFHDDAIARLNPAYGLPKGWRKVDPAPSPGAQAAGGPAGGAGAPPPSAP